MSETEEQPCMSCDTKTKNIINGIFFCKQCQRETHSQMKIFKSSHKKTFIEPDQVIENLFIGPEESGVDLDFLKEKGIDGVILAGACLDSPFKDTISYLSLTIDDSMEENISEHFEKCHKFIDSRSKVLVHCVSGISRSSTIVISYLMKMKKMKFQEAHDFLKQKRRQIRPNGNFVNQLKMYEQKL